MTRVVRAFLLCEAIVFVIAALVHRGLLLDGYRHENAFRAESVIAAVLAAGLVATWLAPRRTRVVAIGVQAFALLGTVVGLFTIAVGVGPRTVPDIIYHLAIVAVLVYGLRLAVRERPDVRLQG
jgi:hypothetical protein